MRNFFLFFILLFAHFFSCKNAEQERGDEEEVVSEASRPNKKFNIFSEQVVLMAEVRKKDSCESVIFLAAGA